MSRYIEASCKLCRREGTKLFLKGARCMTEKCSVEKRAYAPGQHGQTSARRRKASQYARQLREKQKVKRIYGLTERQFRNTFERINREPGITGENLLIALETRLDNVVYRMGFAASRKAARQLVSHGHVQVNGRRVDVPSFRLRQGDEIRVAPGSKDIESVVAALDLASKGQTVAWLAVDREARTGRITEQPTRDTIPVAAEEQLIVELYSK
ncbi:MAG TPA: 30S ribosomal protein S4 [Gemmatimonadales bacterium]|nr:30S ribosomal protein S4 [Gemmatimonadales bacterium]